MIFWIVVVLKFIQFIESQSYCPARIVAIFIVFFLQHLYFGSSKSVLFTSSDIGFLKQRIVCIFLVFQ